MADATKRASDDGIVVRRETWLSGPTPAVIESVRESSKPSAVYWLMNGLASVIASYGLLANSPAVVIGAMVVAMLLRPISGVALGLNGATRNCSRPRGKRSQAASCGSWRLRWSSVSTIATRL